MSEQDKCREALESLTEAMRSACEDGADIHYYAYWQEGKAALASIAPVGQEAVGRYVDNGPDAGTVELIMPNGAGFQDGDLLYTAPQTDKGVVEDHALYSQLLYAVRIGAAILPLRAVCSSIKGRLSEASRYMS